MQDLCPCCSKKNYEACCGPYLAGQASAPTAEALMRSRYTAHVKLNIPYLITTVHPLTRGQHNPMEIQLWAGSVEWLKLEVLKTSKGSPTDAEGRVDFKAWYIENGRRTHLHGKSLFLREDGKWRYWKEL
jgi:SEC-C motif-containing protein